MRFWASSCVVLPVFLQAPWVHFYPFSALLFTFVLLGLGSSLVQFVGNKWTKVGSLLVGVSGSWLGGCLFWGWLRMYPVLHLPVEAVALPLAFVGLSTKWRIGSGFYLACLLGTAFTDLMMVITGVIDAWPDVVAASLEDAADKLNATSIQLLNPLSLFCLVVAGLLIIFLADQMNQRGTLNSPAGAVWLVAGAALTTTLWVDGLFLVTTIIQPKLSGLI
ncbi:DUF3120 domain-containing protein [Prochlorococcus marinus]|uniref:DUF3120 domain-containing protein n=1 Tax=Prochlorococcus marinus TaxID=1219 RepID=UPI0022B3D36A|nr:DUF3120 domain-containing protein [Prochlorococcus marinus]